MEGRNKLGKQLLSQADFQAFKSQAFSCVRISHYPEVRWHSLDALIARNKVTSVFKSTSKGIEQPDQTGILKQTTKSSFVVKMNFFSEDEKRKASNTVVINAIATRIPGAKIKPPVLNKYDDGGYLISMIMAELKGQTMAELLFVNGSEYKFQRVLTIPVIDRLQIMFETAWFLQSKIHASRIVHRDITPANVMVDRLRSEVKIFDFDHCKLAKSKVSEGHGTPLFMSPEAFLLSETTYKTDVFGLAWIFYLLLDGKLPSMYDLEDAERVANHYQPEGLFSSIGSKLNGREKKILSNLLIRMFNPDISTRCNLKYCVTIIEEILLKRKLKEIAPEHKKKMKVAYSAAKTLRDQLINVAFKTMISDELQHDISALFNEALASLPAMPDALPAFLATLRVDVLSGLTSVDAIKQKVHQGIASFYNHYQELSSCKDEILTLYTILKWHHPEHESVDILANIKTSIDYLFSYYNKYFWSLDNVSFIDRKLVKMLDRAHIVIEDARVEVEKVKAEQASSTPSDWMRFLAQPNVPPNDEATPPAAKRTRYY